MAVARVYKVGVFDTATVSSAGAAVATTTTTPILSGSASSTGDFNISAVRVGCLGATSFPANASFAGGLSVLTSTTLTGGNAATAVVIGQSALAANTKFLTAGGNSAAAITGGTIGHYLWSQEIPFTAGANWGEWFTPGFEINVAASALCALTIAQSSAGSGTTFSGEIEFTE